MPTTLHTQMDNIILDQYRVFKANSNVKSTKTHNLQVAYYCKFLFMLDEWEIHT